MWRLLLIGSLIFCANNSVAAQIGTRRKRSGQQNLRIVYKDRPKMYAVAAKFIKTPLGIFNDTQYPLVDIILQYAFDTECVVAREQIREHHGTVGVGLFRHAVGAVNNMLDARASFEYFNGEVVINHSKRISYQEIARVASKSNCG